MPFAVYVYSMQRHVGYWDVGEMQTVPYIFGIAHPTGFPAFVVLGFLFSHALPLGTVAWRLTLLCALAMSGAAYVAYRLIVDESGDAFIALPCAWLFAFGETAWTRGTRTEVHALVTFFAAVTLYCMLRWSRTLEKRWLYAAAVAWALALATHPVAGLLGAGLFALLLARWQDVSGASIARAVVLCAAIVGAFYAYLPLRSAQVSALAVDPSLTLSLPPGQPFWDYDHPATRAGFVQLVTGSDFPVGDALAGIFLPQTYVARGHRYLDALRANLGILGVVAAFLGILSFLYVARWRAAGFLLSAFFAIPFALAYPIESDVGRYFLFSFFAIAVTIGVGFAAAVARRPLLRAAAFALVLALAAEQLYEHSSLLLQRFDSGATGFISTVREKSPDGAIVISPWTYATPLAYADYVEGTLGHRIVVVGWLSDHVGRVPAWMRKHPVVVVYQGGDPPPGYFLSLIASSDPPLYRVYRYK